MSPNRFARRALEWAQIIGCVALLVCAAGAVFGLFMASALHVVWWLSKWFFGG